jgi:serine/threonine protein kinase
LFLFYCYIAKDKKNEKKVLIKSYKEDLMDKNKKLFEEELNLFKAFKENQRVLHLKEVNKENNRFNLIFDFIEEIQTLDNYIKNTEIKEKTIKKFNKILYNDIFLFNESNHLPFIFISIHNFIIDKNSCPIIFDFGLHKLLIPEDEYSFYFLPDKSEMNNTQNKMKTNIMNYGITLLKLFSGKNIFIRNKEIALSENIIMSEDFRNFLSKCLTRNINKRSSWKGFENCNFVIDDNIESSNIFGDQPLIDNEKLTKIFEFLNQKFDLIINYYNEVELKNNPNISQIEIFTVATLFEMKIINEFFNRNIDIKPFTNQQELSFISINTNGEMNKCDLNFVNPILKDVIIVKMNNNQLP